MSTSVYEKLVTCSDAVATWALPATAPTSSFSPHQGGVNVVAWSPSSLFRCALQWVYERIINNIKLRPSYCKRWTGWQCCSISGRRESALFPQPSWKSPCKINNQQIIHHLLDRLHLAVSHRRSLQWQLQVSCSRVRDWRRCTMGSSQERGVEDVGGVSRRLFDSNLTEDRLL